MAFTSADARKVLVQLKKPGRRTPKGTRVAPSRLFSQDIDSLWSSQLPLSSLHWTASSLSPLH